MRILKPLFVFVMLISASILSSGCATTPAVSDIIQEAPSPSEPPQILSAKGFLSPKQSKALILRLEQTVDPTDLMERQIDVIESVSESPLIKGNKVTLLIDGPATYAAMFKAVQDAKENINIETFIFDNGELGSKLADLLVQKRSEGVQVNVIYDSVGSFSTPGNFFQRLHDGRIQMLEFNPINPFKARGKWRLTHRDHRKILIVDGKVAITGGINVSKVYSHGLSGKESEEGDEVAPWRDTDIQVEGPAVAEFQKLFFDTWQTQMGPKLPEKDYFPGLKEEGPDLMQVVGSTPGQMNRITFIMYVSAVTFASNTIHMTNAYFSPDEQMMNALSDAAMRGVDVKIILPDKSDSPIALYAGKFYYSDLLKSGVKLFERSKVILHAKTAVIDGVWSTVGSTNIDFWSFLRNDEVNAVILNRRFAVEMEKMFAKDLEQSDEVTWEKWKERPLFPRIREWLAHLFMRWL